MSRTFFLMPAFAAILTAQQLATVQGDVVDAGGNAVSNMTASLCLNSICGEQVQIHSGRFRFQIAVAPGHYTVQVHATSGETLHEQTLNADLNQAPTRIVLPDTMFVATRKTSGQISIQRLQHHPPKAATRELEKALASFRKNESQAGAEHLEKALKADPEFSDAHYLLGLTLEANGFNEQALPHLENAAPAFPKAHVFAAKILSRTGHEQEAHSHLRKYLRTGDPTYRDKVLNFFQAAK